MLFFGNRKVKLLVNEQLDSTCYNNTKTSYFRIEGEQQHNANAKTWSNDASLRNSLRVKVQQTEQLQKKPLREEEEQEEPQQQQQQLLKHQEQAQNQLQQEHQIQQAQEQHVLKAQQTQHVQQKLTEQQTMLQQQQQEEQQRSQFQNHQRISQPSLEQQEPEQRQQQQQQQQQLQFRSLVCPQPQQSPSRYPQEDQNEQPWQEQAHRSQRRVRFSSVQIQEYSLTVGDHPLCKGPFPLTMDWNHTCPHEVDINEYGGSYSSKGLLTKLTDWERIERLRAVTGFKDSTLMYLEQQLFLQGQRQLRCTRLKNRNCKKTKPRYALQ